jgi:hypothetical protein
MPSGGFETASGSSGSPPFCAIPRASWKEQDEMFPGCSCDLLFLFISSCQAHRALRQAVTLLE